ncbi:MAG: ABC transporter ATP-binding protein/permease [Bdellovibrionales bacterium]|nr:ABC transporter ATP-binding protein/permease [Bdellovibrionales bacterium]
MQATSKPSLYIIKRIWEIFKDERRSFYVSLILIAIYIVLSRTVPFLYGAAIDYGVRKQDLNAVYIISAIYLVSVILHSGFSYWSNFYLMKMSNSWEHILRGRLIKHVLALPIAFFDKNSSGRTTTRVTNDVSSFSDLLKQGLGEFGFSIISIASLIVSLLLISVPITLCVLAVMPIIFIVAYVISKKLRVIFLDVKRYLSDINSFSAESFSGYKVIHLFNIHPKIEKDFNSKTKKHKDSQLESVKWFALLWPLLDFMSNIYIIIALSVGYYLHTEFNFSAGELSAYILLLQQFFKPIRQLLEKYTILQSSFASTERIISLLDEPEEKSFAKTNYVKMNKEILVKNLNFAYGTEAVLKNVNLKIPKGKTIALVGRTGSGKSTLVKLLQKQYPVEDDCIFIDQTDINSIDSRSLRKNIVMIQQDAFLFKDTLKNNITLKSGSEPSLDFLKSTQVTELEAYKSKALDFEIDEYGQNLSSGEKQIINLARSVYHSPDILILDEATAHIDVLMEQKLQRAIQNLPSHVTKIYIAHRLSTIKHADIIYVLKDGQVTGHGNHESLMTDNSYYRQLVESNEFIQKNNGSNEIRI